MIVRMVISRESWSRRRSGGPAHNRSAQWRTKSDRLGSGGAAERVANIARSTCDGMLDVGATITTTGGNGTALVSCAAGGCDVAATVETLQQHCARIVEIGGASWCLALSGQQQARRTC